MNDPKVLQNIAEKACQFDRAHFGGNGNVAAESLLSNHERLPADRKLITRLRPRYAVALGFFEGYALAIEDGDELRSGPFIELLRSHLGAKPHEGLLEALERVSRERDELQTKLVEAERIGAEHASQLEDEIRALVAERDRYKREATESKTQANIGIVIKPPPPPPPAAPPAPNELRTEIDDELAQAAAEYANDEEGYPTTARDIDEVHDAMKAGKGWYAVARAFVHGAQRQLSRIENAHAGDDPTMHLPPAFDRAPMPSDREIVELLHRNIYPDVNFSETDIEYSADVLNDDPENIRRKIGMYSGLRAEACAIKFALLHFRDRLVGPANEVQNSERTQYETTIRQKNERIAELEKQLGFDCIDGTEKGEGVEAKLELKIQKQNDLLRLQNADLNKARSRIAELEEQLKDEIENLNETARENVKLANDASELRASIVGYFQNEHRSNSASLAARNHLRSLVGLSSSRSATPAVAASEPESEACDAIVFRDDAERDYWEETSLVLAAKKDTTSQSIATGADEMVEERRKRLSVRIVSENGTRQAIVGVRAADEVTDELLLEAAHFANSVLKLSADPSNLETAKVAMEIPNVFDAPWKTAVRFYVNGAQRSSRKP